MEDQIEDPAWEQIRAKALTAALALRPGDSPEQVVELAGRLAVWIRHGDWEPDQP